MQVFFHDASDRIMTADHTHVGQPRVVLGDWALGGAMASATAAERTMPQAEQEADLDSEGEPRAPVRRRHDSWASTRPRKSTR